MGSSVSVQLPVAGLNSSAASCILGLGGFFFYDVAWVMRSIGSAEIQGFALGGHYLCLGGGGAQPTSRLEQLITVRKLCLAGGGDCEKRPLKGSSSFFPALEGAAVHFDEGKAPKS